ncbi:serine hydrolase domain-containing protein [Agromyces sp. NPDC057865]|uniref:serine hydrolase domain-containing protein n=1 Tax=Agromyces sp. NPDC057865 TaxID=3346267 RepID=UPI003672A21D
MGTSRADRIRRTAAAAVLVAGAFALTGCVASPAEPVAQSSPPASDAESEFERDVRTQYDGFEWREAAAAVINEDGVERAFVGADEETVFEIGSITKTMTGQLLAEAIDRGEVTLDDRLGDHLPLGDAPAAGVTLRSLATHSSGLPTDPTDPVTTAALTEAEVSGANPFEYSLDELLALARTETLTPSDEPVYSNFAAALLGQALAAAAGTDYDTLLQERFLDPVGLDDAVLVQAPDDVPGMHAGGHRQDGRPVEAWAIGAYSPAGGIDATLDDLVTYAQAVLDGPLSDSAALEPIAPGWNKNWQFGYFWWIEDGPARVLTVHEGQTGGFSSALLIDREAGTASILLVNQITDPIEPALRYLVRYAED